MEKNQKLINLYCIYWVGSWNRMLIKMNWHLLEYIYFKEAVPWETQKEFKKYRGDWKEEALPLIENYTIEKIEFSDILGMKELYKKSL